MLADVIAELKDLPGELQTITGYSWDQYRVLADSLTGGSREIGQEGEAMLRQAALQFLGYPNMTTETVEARLGPDWSKILRVAFLESNK